MENFTNCSEPKVLIFILSSIQTPLHHGVCVLTNSFTPVMKENLERSMIFSALALDHSQRVPPLWRSVGRVVADPEIWCEVVEVGLVYLKLTGEYSFPGNGQSPSPSHPCCLPGYKKLRKWFVNSGAFVSLKPLSFLLWSKSYLPGLFFNWPNIQMLSWTINYSPPVPVSSVDEQDRSNLEVCRQRLCWSCPPSPGE